MNFVLKHYALLFLLFVPLGTNTYGGNLEPLNSTFKEYKGAWFKVSYPILFHVTPSIESNIDNTYDSVFFSSPDNDISFYVCSPQWRIDCSDIKLQKNKETKIADENKGTDRKQLRFFTIKANDNSYLRSYQVIEESEGSIQWIIGLKYKDTKTLIKYRSQYRYFKNSVQQFSD